MPSSAHGQALQTPPRTVTNRASEDTPPEFVAGQLRAIVGVEIMIRRVEAKAKLSQNRPVADVDGVISGLQARGDSASAAAVRAARKRP
jgi:transcriptional regulator